MPATNIFDSVNLRLRQLLHRLEKARRLDAREIQWLISELATVHDTLAPYTTPVTRTRKALALWRRRLASLYPVAPRTPTRSQKRPRA